MYSNYSTYSASMLMEMELGSNELEVDFIRMILNVWVTECVKKKTSHSKLFYLTEIDV